MSVLEIGEKERNGSFHIYNTKQQLKNTYKKQIKSIIVENKNHDAIWRK